MNEFDINRLLALWTLVRRYIKLDFILISLKIFRFRSKKIRYIYVQANLKCYENKRRISIAVGANCYGIFE